MEPTQHKRHSFMVQIINTRHDTWQGTITWIAENKTEHFRSALEMLHLIDSAVHEKTPPDKKP